MKKRTIVVLVIAILAMTGCGSGSTIYRHSSSTSETPFINVSSSCWWGEARGKYTVSATGYGTLCSGNGYCDKSKAIANPLEIQSAGYEIVVTLADDSTETVTMVAGDTKLISCDSGSFNGYLYVIVYSSLETESKDTSELEAKTEAPYVSKTSSCWSGEAIGKYTISATGYGALCSGNGYCDKSKAIANPLEIQSAGYEIVVKLVADSIETVTMVAGDTQLISCKSGSFNGYLYVIIV